MAEKANENIRSNSGHKQTGEHICKPVTCSGRNYFVENRERYIAENWTTLVRQKSRINKIISIDLLNARISLFRIYILL